MPSLVIKPNGSVSTPAKILADEWISIGVIGRPHGLDGTFYLLGRKEPIPSSYKQVKVGQHAEVGQTATLLRISFRGEKTLLRCTLADNRNAAIRLSGMQIWISRTAVNDSSTHEILWSDLEGRPVIDRTGKTVGIIKSLYNAGASDIATIADGQGGHIDLPVVPDFFDLQLCRDKEIPIRLAVEQETFADLWHRQQE